MDKLENAEKISMGVGHIGDVVRFIYGSALWKLPKASFLKTVYKHLCFAVVIKGIHDKMIHAMWMALIYFLP